jgi:hypothetical protein
MGSDFNYDFGVAYTDKEMESRAEHKRKLHSTSRIGAATLRE